MKVSNSLIINLLVACSFGLTLFSCNKDNSIQGKWSLVRSLDMTGDRNYEKGQIIWDFDSESLTITYNEGSPAGTELETGVYYIEENSNSLVIDSITYDLQIESTEMVISNKPELDGSRFTLRKK